MSLIGTAAAGLRAQQLEIDTVGNNIANVNTLGFKQNQADFAETLATMVNSANPPAAGNQADLTVSIGAGALANGIGTDFSQGTLLPTDSPLDLGIDGEGFFAVRTPDGNTAYTRVGNFHPDGDGNLTDSQGNFLLPETAIPAGTTDLTVSEDGIISGNVNGTEQTLGQINLVGFQNPEGLQTIGNNLYAPTADSGRPQIGQAGSTAGNLVLGKLKSKSLEQANVDLAVAMTDLLQAQRAYQMNARMISDADSMWNTANNIRR